MTSLVESMFKQTCRTCLSTNGEMVSIFSSHIYVDQLPKKLMAFARVEISDTDDLPKMICKKCLFMADSFYCFKEQCESADNELKNLLIQKNLNNDRSSEVEMKLDSGSNSKQRNVAPVSIFRKACSGVDKKSKIEANNVAQQSQETEENFFVEYISDEVKAEVENAVKRRQEAEKKISMERVSQRVRNLDGIEVVAISDVNATRIERNSKMEKEEIVVFPLKVPKKRCQIIETIVIDDPPPLIKKLRLPPETTVSKVNTGDPMKADPIVYGKCKKLHFSTVRKVVRIDDEKLCIESIDANINESDEKNSQVKYDTDVVVVGNDNGERSTQLQCSEISIDKNELEANSEKQEPVRSEDNLQGNSVVESINFETKPITSELVFSAHQGNRINENSKSQIILTDSCSAEMIGSHEAENSKIDCIIDLNHRDDEKDVPILENDEGSPKSFVGHRREKMDQVFIERVTMNTGEMCAFAKDSEINEEKIIDIFKCNLSLISDNERKNFGESLSCSDEVTPLALLRVNSSGEENSTINLRIYKRSDSEKIAGTTEDDSFVKKAEQVFSAHPNPGNSNTKYYQCSICSMNFSSMPSVLKHNIRIHMADQSTFYCLICDKNFRDKPLLCQHVEEHNGLKPYECTLCPKTFTLQKSLKRHINHHVDCKPLECRICMKRFTEKSSLKSHMHLHTGDSPFACKSCNVSFNSRTNWRRHVITVHERANTVVCKFCNKELPDKRSLRVHTRVHTGDRPYQCPHCDKKFTQQCNLNTHIHCHLNDRPFACPHCGKGFNQRGTRDDHILIHTGEKPYKCSECDAGFTVASALKRHRWIHTDKDRPYNCDKCKLQFVGLYELRRHLKNRHGKITKPENPRVERVQLIDDKNKGAESTDTLGEPEVEFNETEKTDAVQSSGVIESRKSEITAKKNSSSSCNVDKIDDKQTDEIAETISETKIENLDNGTKEELVNSSDIFLGGEIQGSISGSDVIGH